MSVTRAEVLHVAGLARLRLDDAEAERLTRELNGILEHMDALAAADREGDVADAAPASPAPLRADDAAPDPLAFGPAELSPAWHDGFFTVPRLASHEDAESDPDAPESP